MYFEIPELIMNPPFSNPVSLDLRPRKHTYSIVLSDLDTLPPNLGCWPAKKYELEQEPEPGFWTIPPKKGQELVVKISEPSRTYHHLERAAQLDLNQLFTPDTQHRHALLNGYGTTKDNGIYFVSEKISDNHVNIAKLIKNNSLSLVESLTVCNALADFLVNIHSNGITHGDLIAWTMHCYWNKAQESLRIIDWGESQVASKLPTGEQDIRYERSIRDDHYGLWKMIETVTLGEILEQVKLNGLYKYSIADDVSQKYPETVARLLTSWHEQEWTSAAKHPYQSNASGTRLFQQQITELVAAIKRTNS